MIINIPENKLLELEQQSMLYQANELIGKYKHHFGMGSPYSFPQSKFLAENYSVWLDLYPASILTDKNQSVLDVYGNPRLIDLLANIGIKVIHTNPMQTAGGLGYDLVKNPSVDGGYDRISYSVAQEFGTDKQYQKFVDNAKECDILVAGDIIPGHTGFGADFILALCNYKQYPNLFIMTELKNEHWDLVPWIDSSEQSNLILTKNLNDDTVTDLINKNYIPGPLALVFFKEQGVKDTNWSVTQEITGVDGVTRRWIYLHLFKQGQPTLNWLDPSFAAHQLISGDIVKHRYDLGTTILRLDANAMLGLEKLKDNVEIWSVGHPLASLSTKQLAMLMRKLGGFTYEENNSELEAIKAADDMGPDLSYDFPMRTGYIHAIATGNASLLKLQQKLVLEYGVDHSRLIHAMQNHDNLCYELFHFEKNPDEMHKFDDKHLTGMEINQLVLNEITEICAKHDLSFKLSFGGIQAHCVELIAARLDIEQSRLCDKNLLSAEEFSNIQQLMLLTVFYNAMQPGIFQLSAWDLVGAVHQHSEIMAELMQDGDSRWLCRSGIDLLGTTSKTIDRTISGIPRCYSLFGSLEEQLENKDSFICQLTELLALRKKLGIANYNVKEIIDGDNSGINIVLLQKELTKYLVVNNFSENSVDIYGEIVDYLNGNDYVTEHVTNTKINRISGQFLIPAFVGRIYQIN